MDFPKDARIDTNDKQCPSGLYMNARLTRLFSLGRRRVDGEQRGNRGLINRGEDCTQLVLGDLLKI